MRQPADIDGELLRLRPGKRDAVAQRVEETLVRDPAFSLDREPVHGRDLLGRAADAGERHMGPYAEGVAHGVAALSPAFVLTIASTLLNRRVAAGMQAPGKPPARAYPETRALPANPMTRAS